MAGRLPHPYVEEELQVMVRGQSDVVEVYAGDVLIATHARLAGQHRISAQDVHHAGIPLGSLRSIVKTQVRIRPLGPEVEVRSLSAYECMAAGGGR